MAVTPKKAPDRAPDIAPRVSRSPPFKTAPHEAAFKGVGLSQKSIEGKRQGFVNSYGFPQDPGRFRDRNPTLQQRSYQGQFFFDPGGFGQFEHSPEKIIPRERSARVQLGRQGYRRRLDPGPILGQGMGMGESGCGYGLVMQVRGGVKEQPQGGPLAWLPRCPGNPGRHLNCEPQSHR